MPATSPFNETAIRPAHRTFLATGAAAGDVTCTGIQVGDEIDFVLDLTAPADLTSEFSVTAADTINNTGGTSTATHDVWVGWYKHSTQ